MNWENAWWHTLSGPQRLVRQCAEAVLDAGTVLLRVPRDLCWRQGLRAAVEEKLQEWSSAQLLFEELDAEDQCPDVRTEQDAGYAVLRALSQRGAMGYRPGSGTIAQYLSSDEAGLFRDRILWVKGLHTEDAQRAFAALCAHCRRKKVRMVLECSGDPGHVQGNLVEIRHDRYVSAFDVQLICMMAANEAYSERPLLWQRYAAMLSANLSGQDAELAVALLTECALLEEEPRELLARLSERQQFRRRGGTEDHILHHLRCDGDGEYIKRAVWRTQLQMVMPVLEEVLRAVVEELRPALREILEREEIRSSSNERVESPRDLETGTLYYLLKAGLLPETDELTRACILCLRESRNLLAHYDVCTLEQLEELFRLSERFTARQLQ